MGLQSQLFRGDPHLEAAAVSDLAHIFQGASGPHVAKIQQALIQVDGAAITQDGVYSPRTAAAVSAFKQKRQILNFQGKIDDIVGKKTMAALDSEMLALEGRGPPTPPIPKPPTPKPPTPTPPPRLALSGVCQVIGELKDNPSAPDMKFADPFTARKSITTAAITAPFIALSDAENEIAMTGAMSAAITIAGGSAKVMPIGLFMCNRFFFFGGAPENFAKGSLVSDEAKTDGGFGLFVAKIRPALERRVRAAWLAGLIDDRAIAADTRKEMDDPKFGTGQFSGALAAFIGGFQGYHVEMCGLTVDTVAETYTYSLDIEIFDHFGVDETDINRGSGTGGVVIGAGLAPFFVLQRDRSAMPLNRVVSKYRPFRVKMRTDMGPFTAKR